MEHLKIKNKILFVILKKKILNKVTKSTFATVILLILISLQFLSTFNLFFISHLNKVSYFFYSYSTLISTVSFFFVQSAFLFTALFYSYYFFTISLNFNKLFTTTKTKNLPKLNTVPVNFIFLQLCCIFILLQTLFIDSIFITETSFFNKNFLITNFSLNLFFAALLLNGTVVFFLKKIVIFKLINLSLDFIYSIGLICLIAPYIFFQNNLVSLFLFLELLNILFFFNFVTLYTSTRVKNSKNSKNIYTNFLNLVFFQFWISFFSSILLLWAILHIFMIVGTTEFFFINFFFNNTQSFSYNTTFISCVFFFAFLLKIGVAPLHFLKIELYKNLSYLNIFLFSCYYFIYFIVYIFYLFFLKLPNLTVATSWALLLLLIFAMCTFFFAIFDATFFKTFFAFSTILNFLNALSIIYCNFIFV